jgi:NAD(P)-dependent dehydrogenase (short-subunit alcohol dehydrogenase family)
VVISETGDAGPACASLLAGEGADVHLVVGNDTGTPARDLGGVRVHHGGLGAGGSAVGEALNRDGRVDAVVVCQPTGPPRAALEVDGTAELFDAWETVVQTVDAYQAALPSMIEHGWGRLVCVTTTGTKWLSGSTDSVGALVGLGLLGMHKAAVADVAPHGVTANAVLVDRESPADDVAALVGFLVSDRAGYLNGVAVALDGATSPAVF